MKIRRIGALLFFLLAVKGIAAAKLKIYDLQKNDLYIDTGSKNGMAFYRYFQGKNPYLIYFFAKGGDTSDVFWLRFDLEGNFKEEGTGSIALAEDMAVLTWRLGAFIPPLKKQADAGDQAYFYLQLEKLRAWLSRDNVFFLQKAVQNNVPLLAKWTVTRDNVNLQDDSRQTLLHQAAFKGHVELAETLVAARADVNARDNLGHTPLHYAAYQNNTLVEYLLAHGAQLDALSNGGQTPLFKAIREAVVGNVEIFLRHRTKLDLKDNEGMTPLAYAKQLAETKKHARRTEIYDLLKKAVQANRR